MGSQPVTAWQVHAITCSSCQIAPPPHIDAESKGLPQIQETWCNVRLQRTLSLPCDRYRAELGKSLEQLCTTSGTLPIFMAILRIVADACTGNITEHPNLLGLGDCHGVFYLMAILKFAFSTGGAFEQARFYTLATDDRRLLENYEGCIRQWVNPEFSCAYSFEFNVQPNHLLLWTIVWYSSWSRYSIREVRESEGFAPDRLVGYTIHFKSVCRFVRAFAAQVFLLDAAADAVSSYFAVLPVELLYVLAKFLDRCCFRYDANRNTTFDAFWCPHGSWNIQCARCTCFTGWYLQPPPQWNEKYAQVKVRWTKAPDEPCAFEPVK